MILNVKNLRALLAHYPDEAELDVEGAPYSILSIKLSDDNKRLVLDLVPKLELRNGVHHVAIETVEGLAQWAQSDGTAPLVTTPTATFREFASRLQAASIDYGRDEPLTGADLDPLEALMQGWQP